MPPSIHLFPIIYFMAKTGTAAIMPLANLREFPELQKHPQRV